MVDYRKIFGRLKGIQVNLKSPFILRQPLEVSQCSFFLGGGVEPHLKCYKFS